MIRATLIAAALGLWAGHLATQGIARAAYSVVHMEESRND